VHCLPSASTLRWRTIDHPYTTLSLEGDGGVGGGWKSWFLLTSSKIFMLGGRNAWKCDYVIYGWFLKLNKIPPPVHWTQAVDDFSKSKGQFSLIYLEKSSGCEISNSWSNPGWWWWELKFARKKENIVLCFILQSANIDVTSERSPFRTTIESVEPMLCIQIVANHHGKEMFQIF
jgi:hypothetical protein